MPLNGLEGKFGRVCGNASLSLVKELHGLLLLTLPQNPMVNPSVESTAGESKVLLKVHLAVTAAGSADRKAPLLASLY